VDHKDHRSIGTLIAIGQADMQQDLVQAFVAADIPAPREAEDAATLRATLAGAGLDLIVMRSHLKGDYVAPMISEVRRGKLGPHPFPIVIVLTDDSDPAGLRQSGGRRPLVVTPGYAGPERRSQDRV
jgi:hypothetical protein